MLLVLAAMPEEAAPFLDVLAGAVEAPVPFAEQAAWRGELAGRPAVVATCGIGLAAAAAAAGWGIPHWGADFVISAGSCGGLGAQVRVADVIVADATTYSSADATEFGYERGQVPRQPTRFPVSDRGLAAARELARTQPGWHLGRVLSADTFVTASTVDAIRAAFPDAVGTDMESCAIAQVAHSLGCEFLSVRGVSDLCDPNAAEAFHVGVEVAAARSRDAVVALLGALDAPTTRR